MMKSTTAKFVLIIAVFVIIVVAWYNFSTFMGLISSKWILSTEYAPLEALFSGLAFAALIITLFMQRAELKVQKEELVAQREELKGQKEQLKKQNESIVRQTFENTLFQLLGIHNDIVNSIEYMASSANREMLHGRNAITALLDRFGDEIRDAGSAEQSIEKYQYWFDRNSNYLGNYFRTIYNMIKYIDQSGIEDKRLYVNLIRAQLSDQEIVFLLYNGVSKYGQKKFKPLMEKYSVLKNLNRKSRNIPAKIIDGLLEKYSVGAYEYRDK